MAPSAALNPKDDLIDEGMVVMLSVTLIHIRYDDIDSMDLK